MRSKKTQAKLFAEEPEAGRRRRGRPTIAAGPMPRVNVILDERAGVALLEYAQLYRVTVSEAVRELAEAWGAHRQGSADVRKAVASWRATARPSLGAALDVVGPAERPAST